MRRACGLRLAREMADGGTPIGLGARCICCATPARGEREGERKGGGREGDSERGRGKEMEREGGRESARESARGRERPAVLPPSSRLLAPVRLFAARHYQLFYEEVSGG
eukprot:COSAG03_NODE_11166_length_608_cov_1.239686_2_plen_109_part_00